MESLYFFIQKVRATLNSFMNQHDQNKSIISEHENCWCTDKIDLLLEDQRKDPDESLLKVIHLRGIDNCIGATRSVVQVC